MLRSLFIICIGLLVGCSSTESDNVKTDGIRAEIKVIATGNSSTKVEVTLYVGSGVGGSQLELTSSDSLTAFANGEEHTLTRVDDILSTYYETAFSGDSVNTQFLVSFTRSEDTSAPSSTVMLPDPFGITSEQNLDFQFNDVVTLNWTPTADGDLSFSFTYICSLEGGGSSRISIAGDSSPDDGTYRFQLSDLPDNATSCDGTVILERSQAGSLDPNFGEGGFIRGIQRRTYSFDVVQ